MSRSQCEAREENCQIPSVSNILDDIDELERRIRIAKTVLGSHDTCGLQIEDAFANDARAFFSITSVLNVQAKATSIEKWIRNAMGWERINANEDRGDAVTGNGEYVELRTSTTNKSGTLNVRQIRIWQGDIYTEHVSDERARVLFIGNPPFGTRGSLAKRFIAHCIELNATTIAFILPDTFSKMSNQRVFDDSWRLISSIKLPRESFTLRGEPYHVPCSFFIWTSDEKLNPGLDMRETKPI